MSANRSPISKRCDVAAKTACPRPPRVPDFFIERRYLRRERFMNGLGYSEVENDCGGWLIRSG